MAEKTILDGQILRAALEKFDEIGLHLSLNMMD